jgi:hypothetical protein
MSAGYSYSGYTKLVSPSWLGGSALARILRGGAVSHVMHVKHVWEGCLRRSQVKRFSETRSEYADQSPCGKANSEGECPEG